MARIISIDFGLKRTGLAVTDPMQIIASGLETVETKKLIPYLKEYMAKEEVEAIVLGHPRKLNTEDTHTTQPVLKLEKELNKIFPDKPVHLIDERFTSKMALDAMIASGSKKKDRRNKGNIDKVSAVIILQSYLEQKGNSLF
ncbi:Holliday junction resolvase RuvX [Limibacter armeniacum]|uniref:Holliday junction resolvase RuvX n=1 Tax=Limibacter armeniacum TaxID=466084 RepID=UPI002FE60058